MPATALNAAPLERQELALIQLDDREKHAAMLLAAGATTDEVAAALCMSRSATGQFISNLMSKTKSGNRTHLVARLLRAGKIR